MKTLFASLLTLSVSAVSTAALADVPAAPASAAGGELALRPTKPIELAPPSGTGMGYKLLFAGAVAGFIVYAVRRRTKEVATTPRLRVTARVTVGLRTELLVVEVDAESFLLGVGPSGVQRLADLGVPRVAAAEDEAVPEVTPIRERFERLLGSSAELGVAARAPQPAAPKVAGQADGIVALARRTTGS